MLPVRQRLLAFEGPEPTPGPWPLQNDVYPPRNSGFKSGSEPWYGLRRRQITSSNPTCGYLDGDPDQPRTADSGFTCRVDTENALWGSCPVSVISASDCGLAAACVDSYACIRGCGTPKTTSLTTFTCSDSENSHCSTALLEAGPDQTYSYIVCGHSAITDHLFEAATTPSAASTSSSSSLSTEATPSISSPSSTGTLSSTASTASSATSEASSSTILSTPSETPTSSVNNTGAIVGGVLGGLAFIILTSFAIVFLRIYRKRHPKQSPEPTPIWNDGSSKTQPIVNHTPIELLGSSQLPYELPGERERVPIELDRISRRSFDGTEFSRL